MARLTVEDCVERVSNRFELVLLAAQRARDLGKGAELTVDRDNDKHPVIALREIADDTISLDAVRRKLVYGSETEEDENADNVEELGLAADNPLDRALPISTSTAISTTKPGAPASKTDPPVSRM